MDRKAQNPIYPISLTIDTVSQFLHRRWHGFHAPSSLTVGEHYMRCQMGLTAYPQLSVF